MSKKPKKYSDRELERMHAGPGFRKGRKAEAERALKEHKRTLLGLVLAFIVGVIFGGLLTRRRND